MEGPRPKAEGPRKPQGPRKAQGLSVRALILAALVVALPAFAFAQFGHPLKGAWSGQWGSKDSPSRLLLDIEWDGKDLTGKINPGTDSEGTVKKVTIDYSAVDSVTVAALNIF